MNKVMILAILVAYKAFNNKSLTIVVNEGNHEYVVNNDIIDDIDCDIISVFSNTNGDMYCKTIDFDDIYDDIDDYEYPYNHINRSNL